MAGDSGVPGKEGVLERLAWVPRLRVESAPPPCKADRVTGWGMDELLRPSSLTLVSDHRLASSPRLVAAKGLENPVTHRVTGSCIRTPLGTASSPADGHRHCWNAGDHW